MTYRVHLNQGRLVSGHPRGLGEKEKGQTISGEVYTFVPEQTYRTAIVNYFSERTETGSDIKEGESKKFR